MAGPQRVTQESQGQGQLRGGNYRVPELFPGPEGEAQSRLDACQPRGNLLAVGFGGVGISRIPGIILARKAREFFAQEWKELFGGTRHKEQDSGGDPERAGIFCGGGERFEFTVSVGNTGN